MGPLVAQRKSSVPPGTHMQVYPVAAGFATSCVSPGCWCRDRRPCYPSDLDDAQWAVLELRAREVMTGLTIAVGRPMVHDLRAMCDAVAYVVKNGVEWGVSRSISRRGRRCMRSSSGGMAGAYRRHWSRGCDQAACPLRNRPTPGQTVGRRPQAGPRQPRKSFASRAQRRRCVAGVRGSVRPLLYPVRGEVSLPGSRRRAGRRSSCWGNARFPHRNG
jgi:hypothetical protein